MPVSEAVPSPLLVNVRPAGRAPFLVMFVTNPVGLPVVVKLRSTGWLVAAVAAAALVNAGTGALARPP